LQDLAIGRALVLDPTLLILDERAEGIQSNVFNGIDELIGRYPGLDLVFVDSGGDNLSATFSPELSDLTIYVIDVAAGDKIPRKGGPGITRSDLLIINKTDLAPMVGASLDVMARDAAKQRGTRPFLFTNLKSGDGATPIVDFIVHEGMLKEH